MESLALPNHPHGVRAYDTSSSWMLLASLTALALGVTAVGVLLDGVMEHGDLSLYDTSVTSAFIADRSSGLTVLAYALTFLGSVTALLPLTAIALGVLALRRQWGRAGALAAGMSLSVVLTLVLKHLVERARPAAVNLLGAVDTGFAFPSGHTLNATVFFGLVAGLLILSVRNLWARACIILGWLALALGVGASRVYLGYHWMTDVLAGWSLGAAVLGAVALMVVLWSRRSTGRGAAAQLSPGAERHAEAAGSN